MKDLIVISFNFFLKIFLLYFWKLVLNFVFCIFFVDFFYWWIDNYKNEFLIVDPLSDTFDVFIDDLLASDVDLLKGELDFLIMQHLFNSIDLQLINQNKFKDKDSFAA